MTRYRRSFGLLIAVALMALGRSAFAADPATVYTANPIFLHDASQNRDVPIRVTAPAKGTRLPVIVFSHGANYSKDDYLPLTEYWASQGFVVIQPTHIESASLGLPKDDPRIKDAWRYRIMDMRHMIAALDEIERMVPWLRGRVDRTKIIAAGHSFGGHTTAGLVGARSMVDPPADLTDPHVSAGILLAPPPEAPGFRTVTWKTPGKPLLIIVGEKDIQPGFSAKWEDHADFYFKSPVGNRCLAVMAGMQHYLGGILGEHRTEDETPSPASLAAIREMTLAFLDTEARGSNAWGELVNKYKTSKPAAISQFMCK